MPSCFWAFKRPMLPRWLKLLSFRPAVSVLNETWYDPCAEPAAAVMPSAVTSAPINAATSATEFLRAITCPPYEYACRPDWTLDLTASCSSSQVRKEPCGPREITDSERAQTVCRSASETSTRRGFEPS